jgi:uncharacterized protein
MYDETPFFFNTSQNRLFGILHKPHSGDRHFGFVFCNPIVEEKLWTHRVYVNFARKLAGMGYTVLRFDYSGHGDSSGDYSVSTIETMKADIQCALKELRQSENILEAGLLGLRMGATLAALTAEEVDNLNKLILWEPITVGSKYMKELFRINITTQTAAYKEVRYNTNALVEHLLDGRTVNIDGYEILLPFYEQMSAVDLLHTAKSFQGEVLTVQINKREGQGCAKSDEVANLYSRATSAAVVEHPFWKEIREYYSHAPNLYETTLEWLNN